MRLAVWWLLPALLGAVHAQYGSNSANKLRERMKLISGGAGPPVTKAPAPVNQSPYVDIQYSEPKLEGPYLSSAGWNPRGMGHLYTVTKFFLQLILRKEAYPDGMIVVSGNRIDFGDPKEHWQEWLEFYSGPASVVAVGAFFIVLLPLFGLLFCCCRCAGRCGARSKLEKRHDPCKRGVIATFLLIVAVVILFGVVCAFVTNENMKEGTEQLIPSAKTSLKDSELYLKNTKSEVDNLLIDNFKQLEDVLTKLLGNTGKIVKEQLANASRAVVLSNLSMIATGLELIKADLTDIATQTDLIQEVAIELGESLDQTRDELLSELQKCRAEPKCWELLQLPQIRELRVVQNFSQLPDVARTFASISSLVGDGSVESIQEQVMEGQRSLDNIKDEIMQSVLSSGPNINSSLQHTGEQLEAAADKIKRAINEMQNLLNHLAGRTLEQADYYIDKYGIYRYYLGLGVSCALLVILLCVSLGLVCGICGKRPQDLYSDDGDWCSTVAGARFLMIGVWLMFLLAAVLMAVTVALFLVGTTATIGVCRPLADPAHDQLFWIADHFVNLDSIYQGKRVDINMSQIITVCHQNKSMYETLKLQNVIDIDEVLNYKTRYQVEEQVRRFKERVAVRTDRIQLLSPSAKRRLIELAQSPVNDIQFSRYTELLSAAVTNINLLELSAKLKEHADQIPPRAVTTYNVESIKRLLRTKARFLELLQRNHVARVQEGVAILRQNVTSLKLHLRFNHTSLRAAVENLLSELESAQRYLVANGTIHMRLLVDDFAREYMDYVDVYLHRVVDKTKQDIGRCGVLSNVYNATQVAACNRLVDPFNGFWASVGWCLLLIIPALMLSVKLSSLYHKSDAYTAPGVYPEAEYLYDAYADRDNMPLAMSHNDKKHHNHHRNYQETYDNSGGAYMQDYSAHLGRTDRTPATAEARFSDMAPKQWDSRGPPRYQQPATEYERPPPYYYPGPGERA